MAKNYQFINKFIEICLDGYAQGWHERNGGNLTYRLSSQDLYSIKPSLKERGEWINMGVEDKTLAGEYFLTTASGAFMKNIETDTGHVCGIVKINEEGSAWKKVWGLDDEAKPTSEFPSHYLNHCVRVKVTDGASRVIYHAHPANVIALSSVLPVDAKAYSRALWKVMTECVVIFPEGVGVLPWMVPGGADIALATSKLMNEFASVVWSQHGIFCAGASLDEAFGLMHTIEKASEIYIKQCGLMSCEAFKNLDCDLDNQEFPNTITDKDLAQIGIDFGVDIRKEYLEI